MNRLVVVLAIPSFAGAQSEEAEENQRLKKIILDTDIGDDIDDAFGLVMGLNSPRNLVLVPHSSALLKTILLWCAMVYNKMRSSDGVIVSCPLYFYIPSKF